MLAILAEAALRSFLLGAVVWLGLTVLRVRNPHVHMTSLVVVLFASLSMPLLMHWGTLTITSLPLPVPAPENFWPIESLMPEPNQASFPSEFVNAAAPAGGTHGVFNWWAFATVIYACVAGLLLLRLAVGIHLTWRLARAAKPTNEAWVADSDVRVSDDVGGPVTFGSTILVPSQCSGWDSRKRQAVLAHEGAHVANRDFYVLLLASLNRAVFWFSPFAWWQLARLAELAEIISDARAIEVLEDRLSYAEILLDLAQNGRVLPAGLEMARACTVRARVERIVAATTVAPRVGWRKRIWIAAAIAPVTVVSAGTIAYRAPVSAIAIDRVAEPATAMQKPEAVEFYSLGSGSIFAVSRAGDDVFGQLTGQRKLRLAATSDGSYSYSVPERQITFPVNAERQSPELKLRLNGRELRAARIADLPRERGEPDTARLDQYVGWYQLAPNRVLTVTRNGDRMRVQETGGSEVEVTANGVDAFSGNHNDLVIFLRDGQARVSQLLLQEPISGARLAPRIDSAKARLVEEEFARRIAEVPDRFREQTPAPGSKDAIMRGIADLQRGTPNYERMSAALAAKIRRDASQLQAMFVSLGAVESIFFRGVGPGGYDIYGVKFAGGSAEFRLLLGADGKAADVIFRPDGNDEPGGVAACSSEPGLRSQGGNAPVKVLFYNNTGDDIQLYGLDSKGIRTAHGTIGDNMSSSVMTYVDNPWVITDRTGQCLEIVLPGQRTRYHTVETPRAGGSRAVPPRTTPQAGSEERLREHIEALGRGQPNYDRMTSEVAEQTRRQLALDQAILARLGALRAVSFRGVSALGSDVYIAHFANGSAEWRIGLVRDGSIGRIALGPQY